MEWVHGDKITNFPSISRISLQKGYFDNQDTPSYLVVDDSNKVRKWHLFQIIQPHKNTNSHKISHKMIGSDLLCEYHEFPPKDPKMKVNKAMGRYQIMQNKKCL